MEKNEISKAIKKKLVQNGLGFIHVKGGKGTAWGWIDIDADRDLTEPEKQKFYEIFGIELGRNAQWVARLDEWESALGFGESKNIIDSSEYQALKKQFYIIAEQLPDDGTCCGGSGVFILKDGKKIDFWKNTFAQSDSPCWNAEETVKDKMKGFGFEMQHEAGWVD